MKKIITTALCTVALSAAIAQAPEFKSAAVIQQEFKTVVLESFKEIKFDTQGENLTWDFSHTKFKANGDQVYVVNPKEVNVTKAFADATHVKKVMNGGESIAYEFLKVDNDKCEYLGNVVTDLSYNVKRYSDAQILLKLPFHYGESFNDIVESNVGNPIIVNTTFAAYGTLVLPFGTFYNVALIRCEYDYGVVEYKWYQTGPSIRLLATQVQHPDYVYTVAFQSNNSAVANNTLTGYHIAK